MSLNIHSDLRGIAAFVHAVETGSFTAAAIRMGVSKSATGKSVGLLEERLGVRLLDRTTRRLNPTAEGRVYYQSCLRVLEELDSAETLLAARKQAVSGILRVNLPVSFGQRCVMPVLRDVARDNPDLQLDISFADRRVDLVEEGVDLAVRLGDPGDLASIIGRRLGAEHSILCAAPAYLDRYGRPVRVDELSDHDCLAFAKDGQPLPWAAVTLEGNVRTFVVSPRHTISHGEALKDATVSGMGVAYLPTWLAGDDIRSGRLEVIPIRTPAEDLPITALWPRSRDLAPKVRAAVNALIEAFLPIPVWERGFEEMSLPGPGTRG